MADDDQRQDKFVFPARRTDPNTSQDAAVLILDKIPELEAKVLAMLRQTPAGMTIKETAAAMEMDPWSVSPRFAPLQRKGLIVEAGTRTNPETRRQNIIWRAAK
jgi:DNA-binding MarR family transcriptional regulator